MDLSHSSIQDIRQWAAGRSAPFMFWLSMIFLVCLACLVVLWVDVPNLHEAAAAESDSPLPPENVPAHRFLERIIVSVMSMIWPVIALESILHWCLRPWDASHKKHHWFGLMYCVCPALRMCAQSPEMRDRTWLPGLGWRRSDKRLRRRLERLFSVPMILIALMIMPILIIEFFLKAQVEQYSWLRLSLHIGTGVIWFAFAAEFILMLSVADKKIAYCKKHWIDIAIILLPIISFLRSLRILRASRLANVLRIPQIGKMARVYRLRGTAVKAVQALILLEVFQRWFGSNPEKKIDKLSQRLAEVEAEAKDLRRKIAKIERQQAIGLQFSDMPCVEPSRQPSDLASSDTESIA